MKHTYDFYRVELKRFREGMRPESDYTQIVHDNAERGWELVQILSCEWHAEPHLQLIFRRVAS